MIIFKVTELTDEHPGYPATIGSFTASNEEMGKIISNALEARGYVVQRLDTKSNESET